MDRRRSDGIAVIGRRHGLIALGAAAVWGAVHLAVRAAGTVDVLLAWVPFRCPLRTLTGIECPTCGLGHALVEALMGEFGTSWRHHPAGLLVLTSAIAGLLASAITPRTAIEALSRKRAFTTRRAVVVVALLIYTLWGFSRAA